MTEQKLLLCTDMDRTLIPNGAQPESPKARQRFAEFCERPEVTLVYVTGRHQTLVQEAIRHYDLPKPDYAITDVGTKIYRIEMGQWCELKTWEEEIDKDWKGKTHTQLEQLVHHINDLQLQEASKQNTHKLSYYLPLSVDQNKIIQQMQDCLTQAGIAASLIWSIDEPEQIGLLDVLPQNATKLHAIEFLQKTLGYALEEVIFAGDSGNDLPVLGSSIPSVLVANASVEVKQEAQQLAERNGHANALYLAQGLALNMNGNYSAGILEGVWHFVPGFRDPLQRGWISS